jgi:hypothetical protein
MAMEGMEADCTMVGQAMDAGCPWNCCAHAGFQTSAPLVAADRWRFSAGAATPAHRVMVSALDGPAERGHVSEVRGESSPRYLLNQVFRI